MMLSEQFITESGYGHTISKLAIDTGYNTTKVYEFCRRYDVSRVVPIKGQDKQMIMVSHPKPVDINANGKTIGRTKVFHVAVSIIKSELYGWLKLMPPTTNDGNYPFGYCHFPEYDETHFKSLTAEEMKQTSDKKGNIRYEWVVRYKRNERLDCRVYARAAAAIAGMDRFNDAYWHMLLTSTKQIANANKENEQPKKRSSGFWKE